MSDTAEHEARDTLYITDEELIRRLGVPRKAARAALHMFDRDRTKGFPQKQALWGNRRYWPAVKAYFERLNGIKMDAPTTRRLP
jgi:hypothetical protein